MDNLTLKIEKMAKEREGSYIDAMVDLSKEIEEDFEEIITMVSPILIEKIKNEFITQKYFGPLKKNKTSISKFFS